MSKTISLLGSTGSIGRQTLDVAEQLGLRVAALTANSSVERVEEQGEQLVTVTRVWPRDRSFSVHAVSFFRLRGDKVARLEEYWADDGPPPQWRQEMKLGQPLK